jgi:hypothetical protein
MAQVRGAFPFPLAQVAEGTARLALGSGGVWYPPSGEYIITLDASCQLERWDPTEQAWLVFDNAGTGNGDFLSCDGYNIRVRNITGVVSGNTISNAGSGMTNGIGPTATGVSVGYGASNTTGYPTATGYVIIGGSVAAPTVTQAGSGFLVPPLIVIDPPPPGGIQASAIAVMTAAGSSGIASITMVNVGAGYAVSPNFYIIPQPALYQGSTSGGIAAGAVPAPGLVNPANAVPGNQNLGLGTTGALLTSAALTGSGTLLGIHMTNFGGGYTAAPTVTFTGGAGGVAVTALVAVTSLANATVTLQPRVQ